MNRKTATFLTFYTMICLAPGCDGCGPGKERRDSEAREDSGSDDSGEHEDTDGAGGFSGRFVFPEGKAGDAEVILEMTRASDGALSRNRLDADAPFDLPELDAGAWGLRAWLDLDGDEEPDGVDEAVWEPTAVFGLTLPRHDLWVPLRASVPAPLLEQNPEWTRLHDAAWAAAARHVAAGTPENGFARRYMDEGFSAQIFQWDSCFMTLFARYGADGFPAMPTLDDFYGTQREDGYICRVVNEADGTRGGEPDDPSELLLNPPLFAWAEWEWTRSTGDLSRLHRVLPVLDAYHDWIDANARTAPGLYYTSMLGSGMDNAPRDAAYDGWVDMSAQQALGRGMLAELYAAMGDAASSSAQAAEKARICEDVRGLLWNEAEGFFFDLGWGGGFLTDKTLASIWPLVAGCATLEQARAVVAHLADPGEFWRSHPFPSTAADSPAFEGDGHYWRGGVWAPTNHATILALASHGYDALAREVVTRHLVNLSRVWEDYTPASSLLAPEASSDGRNQLWELYAPDAPAPGTRWDDLYLGAQDFVGWTGLGPIAQLYEQVLGLTPDALRDTLRWRPTRLDRHGIQGYRVGEQLVDLVAEARSEACAPLTFHVGSTDAFFLEVTLCGQVERIAVPRGGGDFVVDPGESPLAGALVEAGPFPGWAILGNGRIAVAFSDEPALGAPGAGHLYDRDFSRDLVEMGTSLAGQGGEEGVLTRLGLDPAFAAYAELLLPDGARLARRSFVGAARALVTEGALVPGEAATEADLLAFVRLRERADLEGGLTCADPSWDAGHAAFTVACSDGTWLALGADPPPTSHAAGTLSGDPLREGLDGRVDAGRDLALGLSLEAKAGTHASFRWVLALADSRAEALGTLATLLGSDALVEAREHWAAWEPGALCGEGPLCRQAAANLLAARASSLQGSVPADLTGQFVTDGHPQLYPRDALMVARALERAGFSEEAWEIVRTWLDGGWEGPDSGAFYARYDALGGAVDRGEGADFDVPEWDANGYLAVLVERLGPERLSLAEREVLLDAMDFLVDMQDEDGLFLEGGIVEWVGRLPSTAMSNEAGLDAAARLAAGWGDTARAADYLVAAGRLRGGLSLLYDIDGEFFFDNRDHPGVSGVDAWDTSWLFGPAWGYPPGPLQDAAHAWALENASLFGGGLRYFEGMGYGQDLFFFTTAGAAEYALLRGDPDTASDLLEWMSAFSNGYGLAPERVWADGSGASIASPLSWCAAELALAILEAEAGAEFGDSPVVDGFIDPREYRPAGALAVDADGAPDLAGEPVALYAVVDGDALLVGVSLAGTPRPDAAYELWISEETGTGPASVSSWGQPLFFRRDADASSGAHARVLFDGSGACEAGRLHAALDPCAAVALGPSALEWEVDLASLGLSSHVQLLLASRVGDRLGLLPAWGSLLPSGDDGRVLVTFAVDASGEATRLQPWTDATITLSGDRSELGGWAGDAIALHDDGSHGDLVAGDGTWTTSVRMSRGGRIAYKYLVGHAGDGSWAGVEFDGEDRGIPVQDADRSGTVRVEESFGTRGGELVDP